MPEQTAPGIGDEPDDGGRERRRRLLKSSARVGAGLTLAGLLPAPALAASIVAVRVWPAQDYTRVALELDRALQSTQMQLSDPPRIVIDLEGLAIDLALRDLIDKVRPDDPYILKVRVGQYKPQIARIVLDLKSEVDPQLFSLPPIGQYRHRLVLDLYPLQRLDPLQILLEGVAPPRKTPLPAVPGARDPLAGLLRDQIERQDQASRRPSPPGKRPGPAYTPPAVRLMTIAIDPGHGGEDPGAIGKAGTREKDVVLRIGQLLRERIRAEPSMRAFMTRDADYFVPLATRVAKARRANADLLVSLHADAFVRPTAGGASVYVLSERGASSSAASWLASKENAADLIGGVNLGSRDAQVRRVLLDLSTTAQIKESSRLGSTVLAALGGVGRLHKPRIEQAGFAVLKAPDIPSILVETAFISNPDEERKLNDPRYQARIADAVLQGIREWMRVNPPAARGRVT